MMLSSRDLQNKNKKFCCSAARWHPHDKTCHTTFICLLTSSKLSTNGREHDQLGGSLGNFAFCGGGRAKVGSVSSIGSPDGVHITHPMLLGPMNGRTL